MNASKLIAKIGKIKKTDKNPVGLLMGCCIGIYNNNIPVDWSESDCDMIANTIRHKAHELGVHVHHNQSLQQSVVNLANASKNRVPEII